MSELSNTTAAEATEAHERFTANNGNKRATAKSLGITQRVLSERLAAYDAGVVDGTNGDANAEPATEPEQNVAPDTEPEPNAEPATEPTTEPEPEQNVAPDTEPEPATEPEQNVAPDTEPEPNAEPATVEVKRTAFWCAACVEAIDIDTDDIDVAITFHGYASPKSNYAAARAARSNGSRECIRNGGVRPWDAMAERVLVHGDATFAECVVCHWDFRHVDDNGDRKGIAQSCCGSARMCGRRYAAENPIIGATRRTRNTMVAAGRWSLPVVNAEPATEPEPEPEQNVAPDTEPDTVELPAVTGDANAEPTTEPEPASVDA